MLLEGLTRSQVEWRSTTVEYGDLYVMIAGVMMMPRSSVECWVTGSS